MSKKLYNIIKSNEATFIVADNENVIYQDIGIGVKPIMKVIKENPLILNNATIVDKVIGKAAAILLAKYNAKKVYGLLMSRTAIKVFTDHGIEYDYQDIVDTILNRTGDGLCPLEDSVKNTDDLEQGFINITTRIDELMLRKP